MQVNVWPIAKASAGPFLQTQEIVNKAVAALIKHIMQKLLNLLDSCRNQLPRKEQIKKLQSNTRKQEL